MVFSPTNLIKLLCSANATAPSAADVKATSAAATTSTPATTSAAATTIAPSASTTETKVSIVDTPGISYVQERPSSVWAEHVGENDPKYYKETNRTDNTITLESGSTKVLIDLGAMRVIVNKGNSKKSLNIDEASSDVHGWAVARVTSKEGNFTFAGQEGPIKNWTERKQDGTERKLTEDNFDEWSVYLKDPDGKTDVQLDLFKKIVIYKSGDKRSKPRTVPMTDASITK